METNTLAIEYHTNTPEFTEDLRSKIESRLQKLAKGKWGLQKASINIQNGNSIQREYQVRIAVQDRVADIPAVEKGSSISATVSKALKIVERQLREAHDKVQSIRRRQTDIE